MVVGMFEVSLNNYLIIQKDENYFSVFFILFLIISNNMIIKHIALLVISGMFPVIIPLIIHNRFPPLTKYLTMFADLHNIPQLRNTVASHPIISISKLIDIPFYSFFQSFFKLNIRFPSKFSFYFT